jgi:hypothetical protein
MVHNRLFNAYYEVKLKKKKTPDMFYVNYDNVIGIEITL